MDPPAPFHPTATRRSRVAVGVGVVVVRPDGKIYAGIRTNSHGAGSLALPGGHLELYESWEACAQREVQEEMKLSSLQHIQFLHVTNDPMPDVQKHYVTIFVMAFTNNEREEPVNAEPHKCEGWEAYEWSELCRHENLFGPLANLVRDNPPALQQYIREHTVV